MNKIRLDQLNLIDLAAFIQSGVSQGISDYITGDGQIQSFQISIPSGVDHIEVEYPTAYGVGSVPNVSVSLENDYSEPGLMTYISGNTNESFTLVLSNFTRSSHYKAQIISQI